MFEAVLVALNNTYDFVMHFYPTGVHQTTGHILRLPFDGDPAFNPSTDGFPDAVKQKLDQLLGWTRVVVTALCVAGLFMVAGKMALNHRRGEGGEHAAGLAWVAASCLIIGTATQIVGALI